MMIQEFTLNTSTWRVLVFYHPSRRELNLVISTLHEEGCTGDELDDIVEFIRLGYYNNGCIWSNLDRRCSVIIIGKTTDAAQFNDTYDHEKGHLAMHICQQDNIDPFSEEYQYLTGEIGRMMFPVAKHFLCDHCRSEVQ